MKEIAYPAFIFKILKTIFAEVFKIKLGSILNGANPIIE